MDCLICNICGNNTYGEGPAGRLSVTGRLPYCMKCGSLERHRAIRDLFEKLNDSTFVRYNTLQFSRDISINPDWFHTFEVSVYGGDNSLDLMKIERPNGVYDLVICNHVLEHVKDDAAALLEMLRIVKFNGFVFLSFPDPERRAATVEWDAPRDDQHGHWRVYGRDIENRFKKILPSSWIFSGKIEDPVTEASDLIYIITQSTLTAFSLIQRFPSMIIVNSPDSVI